MAELRRKVDDIGRRLPELLQRRLRDLTLRLSEYQTQLRLLSAENVLQRGYSITLDAETGTVLRNPQHVQSGQRVRTRLATGEITSVVTRTKTD